MAGDIEEYCLICGLKLRLQSLLSHLAAHMEDIALFVLSHPPLPEEDEDKVAIGTVPIILLPGSQIEHTRGSEPCLACGWDSDPRDLYKTMSRLIVVSKNAHNFSSINPNCACCQLTDIIRGHVKVAEAVDTVGPSTRHNSNGIAANNSPFVPSDSLLPAWDFPRRKSTHPHSLLVDSANFAKKCLEECLADHARCNKHTETALLPSRLVDVRTRKLISDTSTIPQNSMYVALSYLWGRTTFRGTTMSSLAVLAAGIDMASLPSTIRDAMAFTQALGFNYIWIDVLCVVQDDDEDKAHEVPLMADTYHRAVVVLAAAWGADSMSGLRMNSVKPWEGEARIVANLSLDGSYSPLYLPHHANHPLRPGRDLVGDFISCPPFGRAVSRSFLIHTQLQCHSGNSRIRAALTLDLTIRMLLGERSRRFPEVDRRPQCECFGVGVINIACSRVANEVNSGTIKNSPWLRDCYCSLDTR